MASIALTLATFSAQAETRVTFKSAKTSSSYYQMSVQLAEAMKKGSDGEVIITVEESQGSVQNIKEAAKRSGNYVFTTPPVLVKLAQKGKEISLTNHGAAFTTLTVIEDGTSRSSVLRSPK